MLRRAPAFAVAAAVAVAFADSSIVVLALPELYVELEASIVGISWIVTAYNVVVLLGALALLPLARRVRPAPTVAIGLAVFLGASIVCGLSGSLAAIVAARAAQGLGAALLLCAALPLLSRLTGSTTRGTAFWAYAGTLGATFGPALGGILTEVFDWRAIFFAQAPLAAAALVVSLGPAARGATAEGAGARVGGVGRANAGLVFVFAALVGALFLAVLLVVTVWDLGPLAGAGVVSVLPVAALVVRPLAQNLPPRLDVAGGGVLLAAGLAGLALLPAASSWYAGPALALCGAGIGLCLPPLTRESVASSALALSGTISIATRHAGLVLALVAVAPLLGAHLDRGGERATLNATAVIIDAPLPLTSKIPISLSLRDEFERTPEGEVPDLVGPFEEHGAGDDLAVDETREELLEAIRAALTSSFRGAFLLCAGFGALVLVALVPFRRGRW